MPAEVLASEAWPIAEQALADHAREVGPRGLTRPVREFAARLDPDGQEPNERELAQPHRELRLTRRRTRFDIAGHLDVETGMKLQALLDALGRPRSCAANGGEPDARTAAERHGDAFAEIIQLATTSGQLPENGGEPFTILLTAPEAALNQQHGSSGENTRHTESTRHTEKAGHSADMAAATTDGTRISVAQLQRIACDATIVT